MNTTYKDGYPVCISVIALIKLSDVPKNKFFVTLEAFCIIPPNFNITLNSNDDRQPYDTPVFHNIESATVGHRECIHRKTTASPRQPNSVFTQLSGLNEYKWRFEVISQFQLLLCQ